MPVQARSAATVEAIYEAAIQVLLLEGAERLTTIRVAERAGVSVGTLYQYYPNKQSLLFAILERHLGKVTAAVERACTESHGQPLQTMIEAVVTAFVEAKMERKNASMALYAVSAELGGDKIIRRLRKRSHEAFTRMLWTAPGMRVAQIDFPVLVFLSSMAGATRAVLEAGASRKMIEEVRQNLILMGYAYFSSFVS